MSVNLAVRPEQVSASSEFQYVPMSREEYELLPEKPKAEWVRGVASIMMAPVAPLHGKASIRLAILFDKHLTEVDVAAEVGFRMLDSDRAPDVMVTPAGYDGGTWVTEPPLLVAEIVSPGSRTTDYITKSAEYAAANVGQYWIIDPAIRVITILRNNGKGAWELIKEVNSENPTAEVELPGHGVVPVELDKIIP